MRKKSKKKKIIVFPRWLSIENGINLKVLEYRKETYHCYKLEVMNVIDELKVMKRERKNMKKLTFKEVMDRYEELVNDEYEFPSFSAYYITDTDCDGTKEKPYKLKCLWIVPIALYSKNENNKYILSKEQKTNFKNILIEAFNKENMYLF